MSSEKPTRIERFLYGETSPASLESLPFSSPCKKSPFRPHPALELLSIAEIGRILRCPTGAAEKYLSTLGVPVIRPAYDEASALPPDPGAGFVVSAWFYLALMSAGAPAPWPSRFANDPDLAPAVMALFSLMYSEEDRTRISGRLAQFAEKVLQQTAPPPKMDSAVKPRLGGLPPLAKTPGLTGIERKPSE